MILMFRLPVVVLHALPGLGMLIHRPDNSDALHGLFCEEEETRSEIAAFSVGGGRFGGGDRRGRSAGEAVAGEDVFVGGDEDGTRV